MPLMALEFWWLLFNKLWDMVFYCVFSFFFYGSTNALCHFRRLHMASFIPLIVRLF